MRRAFGYVRVSSVGQSAEDRDGIPRQKTTIRKWAAANGARIVRWFEDSVSGKTDLENRPALQGLMVARQWRNAGSDRETGPARA